MVKTIEQIIARARRMSSGDADHYTAQLQYELDNETGNFLHSPTQESAERVRDLLLALIALIKPGEEAPAGSLPANCKYTAGLLASFPAIQAQVLSAITARAS